MLIEPVQKSGELIVIAEVSIQHKRVVGAYRIIRINHNIGFTPT
jgi:hypothetical protein